MVIQRIQSLYLLVAAVLLAVFAFFPAVTIDTGAKSLYLIGALKSGYPPATHPDTILLVMDLLVIVITVITIFSFKDLKKQMRLCSISIALTIALLLSVVVLTFAIELPKQAAVTPTWWNVLPFLALVCTFMAHRGITHDRKLLSDSQRLR